jgi:predicted phage terminase large subunit-like protein
MLLPYQRRWVADQSQLKICEKSRRIGISWADASDSALEAARSLGCDTYYVGYNREMAVQYIEDVAYWAKAYQLACGDIEEDVIEEEDKDILTYTIRFSSGHKVQALSSRPSNIRSKKGRLKIDEAAFHEDLPELLKAAIAFVMWGGSVAVWSTHDGVDNPFNELLEEVKRGETNYSHHKISLDDALADGLYKRICLVQNKQWTLEGEFAWRSQLYKDYGVAADEELGCEPFLAAAGKVFNRDWFEVVDTVPEGGRTCRFWDLAATEKDVKGNDPCYTAGVKMRRIGDTFYILDMIAEQVGPSAGDDLIKEAAIADGVECMIRWELEGGSAGKRDASHIAKMLVGYDCQGVRPLGDKVKRAKPFASQAKAGNVKVLKGAWNKQFFKWYHAFPDGKVKDPIDAGSGCFACLVEAQPRRHAPVAQRRW